LLVCSRSLGEALSELLVQGHNFEEIIKIEVADKAFQ
jgi:hypothetical protein